MSKKINTVLVIGLGKVGALVAMLLYENSYAVTGLVRSDIGNFPFQKEFVRSYYPREIARQT